MPQAATSPIPQDEPQLSPYLCCPDASAAIAFYAAAFDGVERMRMPMPGPGGKIGHAEVKIGRATIMLSDEFPEMGYRGPGALGGSPVTLTLYVADVDATFAKAEAAGATIKEMPADQFWGDRMGKLTDPAGHEWMVMSKREQLTPQEMGERAAKAFGEGCG